MITKVNCSKYTIQKWLWTILLPLGLFISWNEDSTDIDVDIDSAIVIAEEAYIYGLPLVTMDITRLQATNTLGPVAGQTKAPLNQFSHLPVFPDADFTAVVRPNADTYYSNAWLDLSQGPIRLSLPTDNERYHLFPMLDAYSNVIESPGTRTTGSNVGEFYITGPEWTGNVPEGMTHIQSPTTYLWVIGRTEVESEQDGKDFVVPLMQKYKLTAPEGYQVPSLVGNVPEGDPNTIVKNMSIEAFFNYMNGSFIKNPPLEQDVALVEKMRKIGIGKGLEFKLSNFTDAEQEALKKIPQQVDQKLNDRQSQLPIVNGWKVLENTGDYNDDYFHRAHVARFGLGANLPEDTIYPIANVDADGNLFHGDNKYIITFEKDKLPPANAFWSLTLYNGKGFFVANEVNRYALGDRSDLKLNEDGSLDIYIQSEDPGGEMTQNWLPSEHDIFNLTLRVYYPREEILNGEWKTPAVRKIN